MSRRSVTAAEPPLDAAEPSLDAAEPPLDAAEFRQRVAAAQSCGGGAAGVSRHTAALDRPRAPYGPTTMGVGARRNRVLRYRHQPATGASPDCGSDGAHGGHRHR